jgi:hypothetical protein
MELMDMYQPWEKIPNRSVVFHFYFELSINKVSKNSEIISIKKNENLDGSPGYSSKCQPQSVTHCMISFI